jgi:hypothetical protein
MIKGLYTKMGLLPNAQICRNQKPRIESLYLGGGDAGQKGQRE